VFHDQFICAKVSFLCQVVIVSLAASIYLLIYLILISYMSTHKKREGEKIK